MPMRFLKGLAISILGLLLFFSLSIFGMAFAMKQTILNRSFVGAELNQLDVSGLLKETIGEQISRQLSQSVGQQYPQLRQTIAPVINNTITDLDPWLKKQINDLVNASYDYFLGTSPTLNFKISLDTVKDTLNKNMRPIIVQAPELAQVPPAQREQFADGMIEGLTKQLPATIDLNQILSRDVRNTLADVKQGISYFQMAYWGLPILMLLLILGIIFINRNLKLSTRNLGTTLLTIGIFEYAGIFLTNYFMGTQSLPGLPTALQKWLPQFLKALSAPLVTFSIVAGIIGLVLLIISFLVKGKPKSTQQ